MRRAAKTSLRITVVRPLLATLLAATAGGGLWAADNPPPAPRPTSAPVASTPAAPVAPVAAKPPEIPAKPVIAAKTLFSAAKTPAPIEARAIGFYSRGCLAGGQALPINGAEWQAMRLSRNRYWGHPNLVSFLQRFAEDARRLDGWPPGCMAGF